jgi:anti-sigma B factor antagonist
MTSDSPGLSSQRHAGMSVLVLSGRVDRDVAARADAALKLLLVEYDDAVAIDVSGVEAVDGTVLGVLLRASRRLAWRNRRLFVVAASAHMRTRLEIAGIDELATVVDAVPATAALRPRARSVPPP